VYLARRKATTIVDNLYRPEICAASHPNTYLTAILFNDRTAATATVTKLCTLFSNNTGITKLLLFPVSINIATCLAFAEFMINGRNILFFDKALKVQ